VSHRIHARLYTGFVLAVLLVATACTNTSSSRSNNPTGQVKFTDVTLEAGIDYIQYHGRDCGSTMECGPESMTGGVAAGDYDNDGFVDLFVTRHDEPPILYRNTGRGSFEDKTKEAGVDLGGKLLKGNGAGWADLDNDGCLDLYVTALRDTRHYLFMNDCNGHFSEQAVERGATPVEDKPTVFGMGVTFGDYDKDGYLDIFVAEWRASMVRGRPTTWTQGTRHHNRLLRNKGKEAPGSFTDETDRAGINLDGRSGNPEWEGAFGFAPTFIDLDGDGWLDLAVAADFVTSGIWWNNGDGTFTDGTKAAGVGTDEAGMGSTFGDYDGDGRIDWFVTAIYDECGPACGRTHAIDGNRLYRYDGNRVFSDHTDRARVRNGAWGWAATFIDYDNDTDLDIAHTAGFHMVGMPHIDRFRQDPTFFERNDGGVYTEIGEEVGIRDSKEGRGLLSFDYDNDGDLDLFLVQHAARPRLFRNDGGNANGWLKVKTKGSKSGRDGIGAKITVTYDRSKAPLVGVVTAGDNYLSMNPLVQHFGLGPGKDPVAEVRVAWPAGCAQTFRDVQRNTVLVADEAECGTQSSW
jgi:hypothetical protein